MWRQCTTVLWWIYEFVKASQVLTHLMQSDQSKRVNKRALNITYSIRFKSHKQQWTPWQLETCNWLIIQPGNFGPTGVIVMWYCYHHTAIERVVSWSKMLLKLVNIWHLWCANAYFTVALAPVLGYIFRYIPFGKRVDYTSLLTLLLLLLESFLYVAR